MKSVTLCEHTSAAALVAVAIVYQFACADTPPLPEPIDASVEQDGEVAAMDGRGFFDAVQQTCSGPYGMPSVVYTLTVDESEVGAFDVDGDGEPDNIWSAAADAITSLFEAAIENDGFRLLLELRLPQGCDLTNCPSVILAGYSAVDSDTPPDTSDDFSGGEGYYFDSTGIESPDCLPSMLLPAQIVDGRLLGAADQLTLPLPGLTAITIRNAQFDAEIERVNSTSVSFAMTSGHLGGYFTACSLSRTRSSVDENALWVLVESYNLQPDIDIDGDGLENIDTGPLGITDCTDGDGTTIPGNQCACDQDIADGYSASMFLTSVGAILMGPVPAAP